MTSDLDKLISRARPAVPDPGEYRRLNRASVRHQVAGRNRRAVPSGRSLVVAAVVLCLAYWGGADRLGSDGFEADFSRDEHIDGEEVLLSRDVFSGAVTEVHGDEADARELAQQKAAREGTLVAVTSLTYRGRTSWTFTYRYLVGGVERLSNLENNPPGFPRQDLPDLEAFQLNHYLDLMRHTETTAPLDEFEVKVDGLRVPMKVWEKSYRGFGPVIVARGRPGPRDARS